MKIKPETAFYGPNSFTPNDDGINDTWQPNGVGISEFTYELMIYNRWGELIFFTDRLETGWDGTRNSGGEQTNTIAQIDVYVWLVRFKDPDGRIREYSGHINLIK